MNHEKPLTDFGLMRIKRMLQKAEVEALDVLDEEELGCMEDVLDEIKDYGDKAIISDDQTVLLGTIRRKMDTEGI